jgi:hypothetical protein
MLTHALPPLQVELAFIVASAGECLGPLESFVGRRYSVCQVLTNKHALCQCFLVAQLLEGHEARHLRHPFCYGGSVRDRVKPFAYVLIASFSGDAEFFPVVTPSRLTAYLAVSVDLSCVFASGVGSGLPCRVCASRDYSR